MHATGLCTVLEARVFDLLYPTHHDLMAGGIQCAVVVIQSRNNHRVRQKRIAVVDPSAFCTDDVFAAHNFLAPSFGIGGCDMGMFECQEVELCFGVRTGAVVTGLRKARCESSCTYTFNPRTDRFMIDGIIDSAVIDGADHKRFGCKGFEERIGIAICSRCNRCGLQRACNSIAK